MPHKNPTQPLVVRVPIITFELANQLAVIVLIGGVLPLLGSSSVIGIMGRDVVGMYSDPSPTVPFASILEKIL
jgi:hypothetical protein